MKISNIITEMDKSQKGPPGWNISDNDDGGKEYYGKIAKPGDVVKKAVGTLNKEFAKSKKPEKKDIKEFAPPGGGDGDDGFDDETLKRLASEWYNGDEDPRVEQTLAAAGWEIGQDEGYEDEPGVFVVQAGDANGNSYMSWPANELRSGVAEGAGNIGNTIKSLYQKIYNAGDDEVEYFYNDSPIFAQYWDEYEGDLDSIIAEVDPGELQVMLDELESYVQNANLAEGEGKKPEQPEADYGDDYQAMVARVKKLAGLGPLKTVYDPQKRVYKNVPTAVQPKKE